MEKKYDVLRTQHVEGSTFESNNQMSIVMSSSENATFVEDSAEISSLDSTYVVDDGEKNEKGAVGHSRIKPPKNKQEWHYHLGGVRHSRVPLSLDVKEVLEVAYVSRIMSKNFRKEGQPEKERIAGVTGMELEKVQEWFKNRRKKDRRTDKKLYKCE